MEISDIRVKLIQDSNDRLKAVCSITLDDEFVVRDLKVVEGTNGLFVAMPSRKLSVHCPQCRGKNHLRARFCNECGAKLPPARISGDPAGRVRMHRDIAHPINPTFREIVQSRVIEKYRAESELSKSPDYTPVDIDAEFEEAVQETQAEESPPSFQSSEYDQLIAGLNKGGQEASAPPREARPVQRQGRSTERRGDYGDRPPRGPRPGAPRQPHGSRNESRRQDGQRPRRNQPASNRQQRPSRVHDEFGEVNGNVAIPGETPTYLRRAASPPRQVEEPQRMAEPQLDQFDEPTPTPRREPQYSRRGEPNAGRPADVPSAPKPAPPPKQAERENSDEQPFGAGL